MSALRLGRKTLQMDCYTHKSIFACTTFYPKINLHTHCGICRSQEWGLMWAGWPSHHCLYCFSCCILTVDSQGCLTGHLPASLCIPQTTAPQYEQRRPCIPGSSSFCPPSLSSSPNGRRRTGINRASTAHKFQLYCWVAVPHATPPPYLTQSPSLSFHTPGGWARGLATQPHPVPLGMLGRKYCAASGTAGAITPYH